MTSAKRESVYLVLLISFHFLVKFFDFLFDFGPVLRVWIQIQIPLVGLDGLLLQSFFFLRLAEIAEGNRIARLSLDGVLKAVDGSVVIALVQVVLADFNVLLCAQGVPRRLIGRILRSRVLVD